MLEVRLKRALRGFSLDVAFSSKNEVLSILGPSGSGKTMTLQCIAGLVMPDNGFVAVNGRVLLDTAKGINVPVSKRRVGFAFQNYALFPHLTASQNVAYGIRDLSKSESARRVGDLLEKMHIPALGDRYPRQLSAGQQQRVALARALAPDPEILLLDEPFSALDALVRERLQLEVRDLRTFFKGSILFVTHDLTEAYNVSSRISIFENGHVVQDDHIHTVVNHPATEMVARIVGIRNLMKGKVLDAHAAGATIQMPQLACQIRVSPTSGPLKKGQNVTVGIRPEHVLLAGSPCENAFDATVDAVTEGVTRMHCLYHVDATGAAGQFTVARSPQTAASVVEQGRHCLLCLPAEHLVVIPEPD
jgi:molybdate transport system ATP-binding protein